MVLLVVGNAAVVSARIREDATVAIVLRSRRHGEGAEEDVLRLGAGEVHHRDEGELHAQVAFFLVDSVVGIVETTEIARTVGVYMHL